MSELTVRQEYAKAAMQAYIGRMSDAEYRDGLEKESSRAEVAIQDIITIDAFVMADAMVRWEEGEFG